MYLLFHNPDFLNLYIYHHNSVNANLVCNNTYALEDISWHAWRAHKHENNIEAASLCNLFTPNWRNTKKWLS